MITRKAHALANRKYYHTHKREVKHLEYKSRARVFVKRYASAKELKQLDRLINNRLRDLSN